MNYPIYVYPSWWSATLSWVPIIVVPKIHDRGTPLVKTTILCLVFDFQDPEQPETRPLEKHPNVPVDSLDRIWEVRGPRGSGKSGGHWSKMAPKWRWKIWFLAWNSDLAWMALSEFLCKMILKKNMQSHRAHQNHHYAYALSWYTCIRKTSRRFAAYQIIRGQDLVMLILKASLGAQSLSFCSLLHQRVYQDQGKFVLGCGRIRCHKN